MPRDRETGVPRDATLLFSAPRPVDHHSARGLRVRTEEGDVDGVLDVSADGRILFWRPTRAMEPRAEHHVTLAGVRDERGTLFDELSSTFVTGGFSCADLPAMVE